MPVRIIHREATHEFLIINSLMHIPRSFIDELLSRADIVDIIDSCMPIKKQGANYIGLCPFHHEKTPSFVISPNKQIYHCFGCGAGGNVLSFLMAQQRLDFVEAVTLLAGKLGLQVPQEAGVSSEKRQNSQSLYSLLDKAAKFYEVQLKRHQSASNAVEYLKKRGLNQSTIEKFHIGYAPPGWNNLQQLFSSDSKIKDQLATAGLCIQRDDGSIYDRFRNRIVFPIHDKRGKVIGFGGRSMHPDDMPKYLNSPETPVFHKGNTLYGLYQVLQQHQSLLDQKPLLVVEGYMDVVSLDQYGIHYAVATLGTATTERHLKLLFRYTKEVVFCFDGDTAGQKAAVRALEIILPAIQDGWHPKFMFLPEKEDPDSLVRQEGKEAFEQRIQQAKSLSDFLFDHLLQNRELSKAEDRAAFAQLALSFIQKVRAPLIQTLLYQELSRYSRISVAQLKQQNLSKDNYMSSALDGVAEVPSTKLTTPMQIMIALVLQYPRLLPLMDQEVLELQNPGIDLLKKIIEAVGEQAPKPHVLLESFRGTAHEQIIVQLAHHEFMVPEETIKLEFLGILEKIKKDARTKVIEQLLLKASTTGLTDEEKTQLQELLKERN